MLAAAELSPPADLVSWGEPPPTWVGTADCEEVAAETEAAAEEETLAFAELEVTAPATDEATAEVEDEAAAEELDDEAPAAGQVRL